MDSPVDASARSASECTEVLGTGGSRLGRGSIMGHQPEEWETAWGVSGQCLGLGRVPLVLIKIVSLQ